MPESATPVPTFFYGTAWKEDATARLVRMALDAGFRAIDTANQRKHYNEAGVGTAIAASGVPRAALFLQTKFTSLDGQDHRLPYDRRADVATQVEQSFASSLEHLGTHYLDSLLLHGPSMRVGLADEDWQAWHAMEAIARRGRARMLGVSNINLGQLQLLLEHAEVPPRIVQNRCYARRRWDGDVRALCRARGIQYQPFSLLTANPEIVAHAEVARIAARLSSTPAQVAFAFALAVGAMPLTGTTSAARARGPRRPRPCAGGRGDRAHRAAVSAHQELTLLAESCALFYPSTGTSASAERAMGEAHNAPPAAAQPPMAHSPCHAIAEAKPMSCDYLAPRRATSIMPRR